MKSNAPVPPDKTEDTDYSRRSQPIGARSEPGQRESRLSISALVCTRNRGDKILQTINSILLNDYPDFTVLVVDQSTDDKSELALRPLVESARLRYLRTPTKGIGLARDIGLREADTDLIAITDDDCDVPTDWVARIAQAFDANPRVAVIYCDVQPGPHDHTQGYIPHFPVQKTRTLTKLSMSELGIGIGAGMAVRRRAVVALGGSDHLLGIGGLPAAEDVDLGYRAILAGHEVLQLASVSIVHHGYRTFPEYSKLLSGYLAGTTGMLVKLIKCGHWRAAPLLLNLTYLSIVKPLATAVVERKRPPILNRTLGIARGIGLAVRYPVDRRCGVFRSSYVHAVNAANHACERSTH